MKQEIEIPEGYEAKIVGNKVVLEPKDSEDESIRQAIVELVKWVKEQQFHTDHFDGGIKWDEMLAYLENQKEYIEDIRQYAYNKGLVDAEEKQKPVKLNDDTELGLDRALQIIKDAKGNLCGYQSDDGIHECEHAIQTLERILKSGIDQKPAEWSEEDKENIELIATHLDNLCNTAMAEVLRNLRPQPHWKPSEEQMYILNWVANILLNHDCIVEEEAAKKLQSLYSDLKKL